MNTSLKGLSSMATRQILAELVDAYRRDTRRSVSMEATGGVNAAQRVRNGEQMDVVILASTAMSKLEADGFIIAGSRKDIARSDIAIAVAADAPSPPIGNPDAVREALLQARSVSYSTGPSGDHLQELWRRWGVAELMAHKAAAAPPGVPVASVIARGEADLGVQQLSELMDAPGVKVVGLLPAEIQLVTVFSGGIASTSRQTHGAQELLEFLASPQTESVKRRYGMEPAIHR